MSYILITSLEELIEELGRLGPAPHMISFEILSPKGLVNEYRQLQTEVDDIRRVGEEAAEVRSQLDDANQLLRASLRRVRVAVSLSKALNELAYVDRRGEDTLVSDIERFLGE